MSDPLSKKGLKRKPKSVWASIGRGLAWIGSGFLWFVTPTGAAELWEKWTREMEEEEKTEDVKKSDEA